MPPESLRAFPTRSHCCAMRAEGIAANAAARIMVRASFMTFGWRAALWITDMKNIELHIKTNNCQSSSNRNIVPRLIFAILIAFTVGSMSFNVRANDPSKKESAQDLLDNLFFGRNSSSSEALDKASNLGLPSSYENIQKLNAIIQSRANLDQKKAAIRVLGQQYTNSQDTGIKNFARSSLLKALNSSQAREIQEAIILVYSRLDYFDDSLGVLERAYIKKIINDDKYYGDLAHLSIMAPPDAKSHIFNEILKSGNKFGAEIIASYISVDPGLIDRQSAKTVSMLLKNSEPTFDESRSVVGALQLAQYAGWIKAAANANKVETGLPVRKFIENHLSRDGQDPRKLLAFVMDMGPQEGPYLKSGSNFSRKLKNVITHEYEKYPENEFYSEAINKLK